MIGATQSSVFPPSLPPPYRRALPLSNDYREMGATVATDEKQRQGRATGGMSAETGPHFPRKRRTGRPSELALSNISPIRDVSHHKRCTGPKRTPTAPDAATFSSASGASTSSGSIRATAENLCPDHSFFNGSHFRELFPGVFQASVTYQATA